MEVTPTVAGSNLTLIVTGSGKTGTTTIATIRTPYEAWAGGVPFGGDANADGVTDGMAWLLGAGSPTTKAIGLLPKPARNGNQLVLEFDCLKPDQRGNAILSLEHSSHMGSWVTVPIPQASGTSSGIDFIITPNGDLLHVTATIPSSAGQNGRVFARLRGTQ